MQLTCASHHTPQLPHWVNAEAMVVTSCGLCTACVADAAVATTATAAAMMTAGVIGNKMEP